MTSDVAVRLAKARQQFNELADFHKVKGEGLKFAYLPIEQAKPLIEQVTSENGITIIPTAYRVIEGENYTYTYDKKSKYDGAVTKWTFQTADVDFLIMGPEDSIEMTIRAEAQDNSDKLVSKVYTMAYKNMVKIVFGFAESPKDDPDATQEEIPKMTRAEKAAQADSFFGKKETTDTSATEASVTEPAPEKDNANIRQATACRKAIDEWISEDYGRTNNEIIVEYVKINGPMDQWAFGTMVHCYKDLRDSGEKLKEVNL